MNIILWAIFGGIAGWIASIIVGKNSKMGCFSNIAAGVIGAFIGGWIASLFGISVTMGFNLPSLLIAVVGAVVVIVIVNQLRKLGK